MLFQWQSLPRSWTAKQLLPGTCRCRHLFWLVWMATTHIHLELVTASTTPAEPGCSHGHAAKPSRHYPKPLDGIHQHDNAWINSLPPLPVGRFNTTNGSLLLPYTEWENETILNATFTALHESVSSSYRVITYNIKFPNLHSPRPTPSTRSSSLP